MGKGAVVVLTENEDDGGEFFRLMVENEVLECEKKNAESNAEKWKKKVHQFEMRILKLNDNAALAGLGESLREVLKDNDGLFSGVNLGHSQCNEQLVKSVGAMVNNNTPDTPSNNVPYKEDDSFVGGKRGIDLETGSKHAKRIEKQLSFDEEKSPRNVLAPPTLGVGKPSCLDVINVSDSDNDGEVCDTKTTDHNDQLNENACGTMDDHKDSIPCLPTPKRKRAPNIVTSDSESDEDDVILSYLVKKMRLKETESAVPYVLDEMNGVATRSRRRLTRSGGDRNLSSMTTERKDERRIPTTDDVEDSESEEVESDSEGDSLKDFIVDDCSDTEASHSDSSKYSEDDNADIGYIISTLGRSKGFKSKWEFEGEMLAAFGKDVELCMKAVCVLHRQQTWEEKSCKSTFVDNGRGFSKANAERGSNLAEFLTDGDPLSDVIKTVEELQKHDPAGVEACKNLAAKYSRQLFEIYKNKEDPFFHPAYLGHQ